jgi:hypothetical protein
MWIQYIVVVVVVVVVTHHQYEVPRTQMAILFLFQQLQVSQISPCLSYPIVLSHRKNNHRSLRFASLAVPWPPKIESKLLFVPDQRRPPKHTAHAESQTCPFQATHNDGARVAHGNGHNFVRRDVNAVLHGVEEPRRVVVALAVAVCRQGRRVARARCNRAQQGLAGAGKADCD